MKRHFFKRHISIKRHLADIKVRIYDRVIGIDARNDIITEPGSGVKDDKSRYGDMARYQGAYYGWFEMITSFLKLTEEDVFVDLGCGKGRALFYMARRKLKKVIGVELDPRLFGIAEENRKAFRNGRTPVELLNIDAASFDPKEGTVFFLFNPFGEKTLEAVLGNIKTSLKTNPRDIHIFIICGDSVNLKEKFSWLDYHGKINKSSLAVFSTHCKQEPSRPVLSASE